MVDGCAVLDQYEPHGHLASHVVVSTDHAAFRDGRVGRHHFLHLSGGQPVARDVDNVVRSPHHEHIAVFINKSSITGTVETFDGGKISVTESGVVTPDRGHAARRQWQLNGNLALFAGGHLMALHVHHLNVESGGRKRGGAGFRRHHLDAHRVTADCPAGFGLPPMVQYWQAGMFLQPFVGGWVQSFAGQEEALQGTDVVAGQLISLRVFLADRPEGGRCREQQIHAVVLDHAPEGAGIRSFDRLALVKDGGAACKQGGIDDIAVPDHPANVRCGPVDISRAGVVNQVHAVAKSDGMAAVVAHNALGFTGGSGRVEDIKRVGGPDRHRVYRPGPANHFTPVEIATFLKRGLSLRALKHNATLGLVVRLIDGFVHQGLVFDDLADFDAAGGCDDGLGLGIIDAHRQFIGCETAKDHGMNGANPGASQHGNDGFRNHGHVENHPVTLGDASVLEGTGEGCHRTGELIVGV